MGVGKMKTRKITLADLGKNDLDEQIKKAHEEIKEFNLALNQYLLDLDLKPLENPSTIESIAEGYDVVQAVMGIVWILENGVSMNNEHIEKMEEYVETGRINNKAREE